MVGVPFTLEVADRDLIASMPSCFALRWTSSKGLGGLSFWAGWLDAESAEPVSHPDVAEIFCDVCLSAETPWPLWTILMFGYPVGESFGEHLMHTWLEQRLVDAEGSRRCHLKAVFLLGAARPCLGFAAEFVAASWV